MFSCSICHGKESREEKVDRVLEVKGRYVKIEGVPSTVCRRCGEPSFSAENTERTRMLVHGGGEPVRMDSLPVYEFATAPAFESAPLAPASSP